MTEYENYILSVVFFLVIVAVYFFWQYSRRKKNLTGRQKFIAETLELAKNQFEIFNIRLGSEEEARKGLNALLQEIDHDGLHMVVSDFVAEDWLGKTVDAYFRVRRDEGPVFYVFNSVIRQIKPDYENSHLILAIPEHVRVEKKRHFIRVKPGKDDVRVIGIWPVRPGKRLPRSTDEIGAPLTHYKTGMHEEPVCLENISASGMALRFSLAKNGGSLSFGIEKGSQLICLVVFVLDQDEKKPTAFWCTAEVMNSRTDGENGREVVLGLEFTNWAVLEQGTGEIHWAHSSPSRGAKPILQWVERIDKKEASNHKGARPAR